MEHYDVKRFGLLLAVQAEIEGMKADNNQRMHRNDSNAYTDADFCAKAEELRALSFCHDEQL